MQVSGFQAPPPEETTHRSFGLGLATSAVPAKERAAMPNRAARRRWLASQPRAIRLAAREARRSWMPPHYLAIEQYMDAPAYEEYVEMSEEDQARIYRVMKNALRRRRQGRGK